MSHVAIPLARSDFEDGYFSSVAKYLRRHWPAGEIKLSRAREILAACLGYPDVFHAEKSALADPEPAEIELGRAQARAALCGAGLEETQADVLARALPLWKLSAFELGQFVEERAREYWDKQARIASMEKDLDSMLLVVEINRDLRAEAWWAPDEAEFMRMVEERFQDLQRDEVIFECISARELAAEVGLDTDTPGYGEYQRMIAALGSKHGWDTELYRSAFIGGNTFQVEPIDELDAYKAAVASDSSSCLFFHGVEEAREAIKNKALWDRDGGGGALVALDGLLDEVVLKTKTIAERDVGLFYVITSPGLEHDAPGTIRLNCYCEDEPVFEQMGVDPQKHGDYAAWAEENEWTFENEEARELFQQHIERLVYEHLAQEDTPPAAEQAKSEWPGTLKEADFRDSQPHIKLKAVIDGKRYNTEKAYRVCDLPCAHSKRDFAWHDTSVYVTRKGRFFIAGEGYASSLWARREGTGRGPGRGLRAISAEEARRYMEEAGCEAEEFERVGLSIEEA